MRRTSQDQRDRARDRAVDLFAEDPVVGVDEPLGDAHEREDVGDGAREVLPAMPPTAEPMKSTASIATEAVARRVANEATRRARSSAPSR